MTYCISVIGALFYLLKEILKLATTFFICHFTYLIYLFIYIFYKILEFLGIFFFDILFEFLGYFGILLFDNLF